MMSPCVAPDRNVLSTSGFRRLVGFLEIDALAHGEILQEAAQAIEAHFHRAEPYPLSAAHDTAASRGNVVRGRDRQAYRAREFNAIGAFVKIDQYRECVRRAD